MLISPKKKKKGETKRLGGKAAKLTLHPLIQCINSNSTR